MVLMCKRLLWRGRVCTSSQCGMHALAHHIIVTREHDNMAPRTLNSHVTCEWLFSRVRADVCSERGFLCRTILAVGTDVRPLSGVRPQVLGELASLSRPKITEFARVRLLKSISQQWREYYVPSIAMWGVCEGRRLVISQRRQAQQEWSLNQPSTSREGAQ